MSGCVGLRPFAERQVLPLRSPVFPVEIGLIGKVRPSLFEESRIRGRCEWLRSRKSGSAPVGMTNLLRFQGFGPLSW